VGNAPEAYAFMFILVKEGCKFADGERLPTRAHAQLAERRRVIVFAMTADARTPQEAARTL
jgi:hypothetical protein